MHPVRKMAWTSHGKIFASYIIFTRYFFFFTFDTSSGLFTRDFSHFPHVVHVLVSHLSFPPPSFIYFHVWLFPHGPFFSHGACIYFFFHFHMILSQFIFVTCSASICIVICNILNTADLCSNVIFLNALKAFFTYSVCISIFICDLSKRNYFDNFFLTVYFHIGHVVYLFNYFFCILCTCCSSF